VVQRGFEFVTAYRDAGGKLPERSTAHSAGYDLSAITDMILPPGKVTLIPTGVKAFMPKNEFLLLALRSGLAAKYALSLINGIGVIDSDYYNNPDNEGHILIAVFNHSSEPVVLDKGTRIAQGIFLEYRRADGDTERIEPYKERKGGFGSTGNT